MSERPDHSLPINSPAYRQGALRKAKVKWTGKLVREGYDPRVADKMATQTVRKIEREYSEKARKGEG